MLQIARERKMLSWGGGQAARGGGGSEPPALRIVVPRFGCSWMEPGPRAVHHADHFEKIGRA